MKACLFSPYLPNHFGGGEKYLFDVALGLLAQPEIDRVTIAISQGEWRVDQVKAEYQRFLGQDLSGLEFTATPLFTTAPWWKKLSWTRQFDLLYYLTDGSFFPTLAPANIAHIQVPLRLDKRGWWERWKLGQWQVKNTNSEFTKSVVSSTWPVSIDYVHQPYVETPSTLPTKKDKVILNVGRFFKHLHSKRQDVLVDIFEQLRRQEPDELKGWKLVLIGGIEDADFADQVAAAAKDLPVEIHHRVDRQELLDWYRRASIYWHATGFEVDQNRHPERVEHFGITTLEAMAWGCIPIVHDKGGQPEVVGEKLSSLLWSNRADCVATTLEVMSGKDQQVLRAESQQRARYFSQQRFEKTLQAMVQAAHGKK